ncbi:unnamed protein product [Paramecium sonneborni]|uniref:Uncharacterized protein n=1 Tax=Paramecium sonneborni TaxID=65129 RepID=A0A8S1RLG4_9CILI|nr:unnamed protein product [Paramecium sonneborni]
MYYQILKVIQRLQILVYARLILMKEISLQLYVALLIIWLSKSIQKGSQQIC